MKRLDDLVLGVTNFAKRSSKNLSILQENKKLKLENDVLKNEQKLDDSILEKIPDPAVSIDYKTKSIVDSNSKFPKILGSYPGDFKNKSLSKTDIYVNPSSLDVFLNEVIISNNPIRREFKAYKWNNDGTKEERIHEISAEKDITDTNIINTTTRDITDYINTEKDIHELIMYQKDVGAVISNIIYQSDIEGNILMIDGPTEDILKYSKEELLKMKAKDLYAFPEDRSNLIKDSLSADPSDRFQKQITLVDRSGELVYTVIDMRIKRDKGHNPQYLYGEIKDITSIKKEDALKNKRQVNNYNKYSMMHEKSTGLHGNKVQILTMALGIKARELRDPNDSMRLTDHFINKVGYGAMLHDIGKVAIGQEILTKNGKLTDEEFTMIKGHPKEGYEFILCHGSDFIIPANVIYEHHERFDGSGYPQGLVGKDISLEGRLVAIADTYEALRAERSYSQAKTHDEAYSIIMNEQYLFDPDLVDIFDKYNENFEMIYSRLNIVEKRIGKLIDLANETSYDMHKHFSDNLQSALIHNDTNLYFDELKLIDDEIRTYDLNYRPVDIPTSLKEQIKII